MKFGGLILSYCPRNTHGKAVYEEIRRKKEKNGSVCVFGSRGMRFKYQAGQIGHSVANGLPPRRHFFEKSYVAWAQCHGDGIHKLVARFSVLQRILYNERFNLEISQRMLKCKTPEKNKFRDEKNSLSRG